MEIQPIDKGLFVVVSPREALKIINSLSSQIIDQNSNSGREEFFTKDGKFFSIAVTGFAKEQSQRTDRG